LWLGALIVVIVGATAATAYFYYGRPVQEEPYVRKPLSPQSYLSRVKVEYFCTRCHEYPPADTLPRAAWRDEVDQAYRFFVDAHMTIQAPPIEDVIHYYEDHAPLELPLPDIPEATSPLPLHFQQTAYPPVGPASRAGPASLGSRGLPTTAAAGVTNVNLVHLFDDRRQDVLACDVRAGVVMALQPYSPSPAWQVLGAVPSPAHAEVVDLDGDGIKDILVADLGNMEPTDRRCGRVVWLRGGRDGRYTPVTLLEGVGRVADVQAADFRGVGKLDLIVAVFGWRQTGEVIYLENQTTDWSHPVFVPRVLDDRHGAIHVPVADLNGDGRPDFVALISQEHETIVAFLNEGGGRFRKETIYAGPHPTYGSTGIQLVDLNGDGKLDVLYTNGDSMGKPFVLKPYHSIQWLENPGHFPFVHHPITPMYGVHRAVAADFRGVGKLDIMAVSFLPKGGFPQRQERNLDSVIYLEQTSPGQFLRHSLEKVSCDHVTCVAGDIFGRGKIDLVTGNFVSTPTDQAITIWKNQR
jgi:hypothetical protein